MAVFIEGPVLMLLVSLLKPEALTSRLMAGLSRLRGTKILSVKQTIGKVISIVIGDLTTDC